MQQKKTAIDKTDLVKLKLAPADLSKLSDVVNYDVVRKTVNDNLAAKVNNIDTSRIVLKTKDDTDKSDLDKKIPDISRIVKKIKKQIIMLKLLK